jgi:hypothetical protein
MKGPGMDEPLTQGPGSTSERPLREAPSPERCTAPEAPEWDRFVVASPFGQFQQSSAWARVKAGEGWTAARYLRRHAGIIVSGVQILWRSRLGVRIGYASKGPVLGVDADRAALPGLLRHAARDLRLDALMVQAPDLDGATDQLLGEEGFLPDPRDSVISATVLIPLGPGPETAEKGFSDTTRYEVRRHRKAGTRAWEGSEADASRFFSLMGCSCARQGVVPNPPDAEGIARILREFRKLSEAGLPAGARLLFSRDAVVDDSVQAGILLLRFGDRESIWKKGAADLPKGVVNPTRFLEAEAMKAASGAGCRVYDAVGIERATAAALLSGTSRKELRAKASDLYKLSFGGTPQLLPQARIWIRNPIARLCARPLLKALAFRERLRASRSH